MGVCEGKVQNPYVHRKTYGITRVYVRFDAMPWDRACEKITKARNTCYVKVRWDKKE
jgi:hypothetical protein